MINSKGQVWEHKAVKELLTFFGEIGAQVPFWTQAQGSNLSVKINDDLIIKPSGFRLSDVKDGTNLAKVSLSRLREFLKSESQQTPSELEYSAILGAAENSKGLGCRASMETGFHALLSGLFVFHFHSLAAIVMAEMYFNQELKFLDWLKEKLSGPLDSITINFLPFVIPGLELSFEIEKLNAGRKNGIFLMKNHGVVIHFDHPDLFEKWKGIEVDFYRDFFQLDLLKLKRMTFLEILNKFNCEMPLKIFFPDLAVFKSRVAEVLNLDSQSGTFQKLNLSISERNRDLAELWLATQILQGLYPKMAEINEKLGIKISQLPTEQFRKGKI